MHFLLSNEEFLNNCFQSTLTENFLRTVSVSWGVLLALLLKVSELTRSGHHFPVEQHFSTSIICAFAKIFRKGALGHFFMLFGSKGLHFFLVLLEEILARLDGFDN